MDSLLIAKALDDAHPTPPLHLDDPLLSEVETLHAELRKAIGPIALPQLVRDVFNTQSAEYKEQWLMEHTGMSSEQFE